MSSSKLVTLTSSDLELAIAPHSGARVVFLVDRHTGRNWLAEGPPSRKDAMTYGVGEAAGWDECFPTVSPCDASATPWRRQLRDHGDLWARPAEVTAQTAELLETTFEGDGFRFVRRLTLTGPVLDVAYAVETTLDEPTPFLWAMHPLFALRPGEMIAIEDAGMLLPTYLSLQGRQLEPKPTPWPMGDGQIPFRLDCVQSPGARFAGKFFVDDAAVRTASLGGPDRWLDLQWEGVANVGLWLTYGAWPEFNNVVHVAIEPTTSPDDTLAEAIAKQRAAAITPGKRETWRVRVTLRGD